MRLLAAVGRPVFLTWALLVFCATSFGAPLDPREASLRAQLENLEALLRRLDGGRAGGVTYDARAWDLHRRLVALEKQHGLRSGLVSRRSDLGSLLLDGTTFHLFVPEFVRERR